MKFLWYFFVFDFFEHSLLDWCELCDKMVDNPKVSPLLGKAIQRFTFGVVLLTDRAFGQHTLPA